MKLITYSLILVVSSLCSIAHADGGSADRLTFDRPLSAQACQSKAKAIAARFGLAASEPDMTGTIQMLDADGESGGVAYYGNGICHIYVK